MRVKLSGLDLATAAGAESALARIRWSAGVFCEAGAGRQTLDRGVVVERCVADMTRKSVSQLNAPLVTALLEGRSGEAQPAAQMALVQE